MGIRKAIMVGLGVGTVSLASVSIWHHFGAPDAKLMAFVPGDLVFQIDDENKIQISDQLQDIVEEISDDQALADLQSEADNFDTTFDTILEESLTAIALVSAADVARDLNDISYDFDTDIDQFLALESEAGLNAELSDLNGDFSAELKAAMELLIEFSSTRTPSVPADRDFVCASPWESFSDESGCGCFSPEPMDGFGLILNSDEVISVTIQNEVLMPEAQRPLPDMFDEFYYVGTPKQCQRLKYGCDKGWTPFADAEGCGCRKKPLVLEVEEEEVSVVENTWGDHLNPEGEVLEEVWRAFYLF